ncbi:MAG TPA: S1/P1 nuclease [Candidatus Acidoferrales bacterium]|nr:S1/P1 nuclease [Candidatus Acidoferrales bacterium]
MRRLALIACVITPLRVSAWGPEGHDLVARLASAHLNPAAAAKVKEILGPDTSMTSVSSWADQVRNSRRDTAPWHFVDIPITKPHLDLVRDCPKGDCVVVKIEEFRKILADPATGPAQRREALMFLIHFIGDMHQPLHCSDNKDRGGNEVRLDFFGRNQNLHSIWDGGLLGRMGTEDVLFAQFSKDLTDKRAKKWGKGSVREWAEESHKAGVKTVYGKLPKPPAGGPAKITPEYEKAADPLIQQQIEKAGARLAATLNAALK